MKIASSTLALSAIAALAAASLTHTAIAQTAATTASTAGLVELDDDDDATMVASLNLSVDQLEDMDVFGADGEKIGEVEDVLGDVSGAPVAVVVEFEDGFLGMGDTDVVVALDQLTLDQNRLVTAMSADEVKALPQWDD